MRKVGSTASLTTSRFRPWRSASAAQRIDAQAQAGGADRGEIHHLVQLVDVRGAPIALHGGLARLGEWHAAHAAQAAQAVFQQAVGARLDPAGAGGVRRAAVGRVVLDAAVVRRIVRGGDDDAVGPPGRARAVVRQDGVGDDRRGGELAVWRDQCGHAVTGQHFEAACEGRLRQRVGVDAQVQRAVDALPGAVVADRLDDGQHMPFVEAARQRTAAMSGSAEGDPLRGDPRIGTPVGVGGEQGGHVHQE